VAAARGNPLLVSLLLKHGCCPLVPERLGRLPLHLASLHGHRACLPLLASPAALLHRDHLGLTAWELAESLGVREGLQGGAKEGYQRRVVEGLLLKNDRQTQVARLLRAVREGGVEGEGKKDLVKLKSHKKHLAIGEKIALYE